MFHLDNGLCFKRVGDKVHILKFAENADFFDPDAKPEWSIEVTDSAWASAVASISARGETYATWSDALTFHNTK